MNLSRIAYGAWRLLDSNVDTERAINACLEAGITTMDHADIYGDYGCEEAFGRALKAAPRMRGQMQIVTKCGICLVSDKRPEHRLKHYNYSASHILESVERSLKNLGTDHIDLLLFHRPSPMLDPDEVAGAVESLVASGKVLKVGVSNFSQSQLLALKSRTEVSANQIEISPLQLNAFENGVLDQCMELKILPMAWSPLGGGRLLRPTTLQEQRVVDKMTELTKKYECEIDQLAYAWLLAHPSKMCVVIGTQNLERIKRSALASKIDIEVQDWFAIWSAAKGAEVP